MRAVRAAEPGAGAGEWRRFLRPRAALLLALVGLLLGSFTLSVVLAQRTFREAAQAQARLAQAARTAQGAQRLEYLASELSAWLSAYALDVNLGGETNAAGSVYAQSFGVTLSELTALLGELRPRLADDPGGVGLGETGPALLASLAGNLTQLNVLDVQIRDAYARGTPAGVREGTALVRGEAFTSAQGVASAASALSRRVVEQAEAQAVAAEQAARRGGQRMLGFVGAAAALLLVLSFMVVEVLRKREQVVRRLRQLAEQDGLTGVANRRHWDEQLARHAAHAARTGRPLSVALLDLDHFKAYNDAHGHQAGDDRLREVAGLLRAGLPGHVVVARYGGEEFGLLFPDTAPAEVAAELDALRPAMPPGATFSAGVAALETEGAMQALRRADEALYAAKDRGRARTVVAGAERAWTEPAARAGAAGTD